MLFQHFPRLNTIEQRHLVQGLRKVTLSFRCAPTRHCFHNIETGHSPAWGLANIRPILEGQSMYQGNYKM